MSRGEHELVRASGDRGGGYGGAVARGLVLRDAGPAAAAGQAARAHDARRADPARARARGRRLRLARHLPASRHALVGRKFRRKRDRVLLPRLAVRVGRALHGDPVIGRGPGLRSLDGQRRALPRLRGAGQRLGLFRRRPRPGAGDPADRRLCRIGRAAPRRDDALRRGDRSRGGRADGPGAWPVCPPRLVVAVRVIRRTRRRRPSRPRPGASR